MNTLTVLALAATGLTLLIGTKGDDILDKFASFARESFSFQIAKGRVHNVTKRNVDLRFTLNITNLSAFKLTVNSVYADIYILNADGSSPAKIGNFTIRDNFIIEPNITKSIPEARVNARPEDVIRNFFRLLRAPRLFKAIITVTANGKKITLNQTFEA